MSDDKNPIEVIRKGNVLIEAKYKLTLNQQRVLTDLLQMITPFDEDFKDYRINIADIAERFNLGKNSDIYERLQESIKDMVSSPLTFTFEKDVFAVSWLSSAKYRRGRGFADVSFHPDLKPLLLSLKEHYTEYPMVAVAGFKCSYSFRFYEWLQSYRYKGKGGQFYRVFTVEEIREKMSIQKHQYARIQDIRRYIIEPSVRDINEFSDIKIIQVDYIKQGRSINEVKFTVEPKIQRQIAIVEPQDEKQTDLVEYIEEQEKGEKNNKTIEKLQSVGVGYETAKKWVRLYGTKHIERNLAYVLAVKQKTEIKNLIAYLAKAISEDMADGWEEEKDKAISKKQEREDQEANRQKEHEEQLKRETEEYNILLQKFTSFDDILQDVVLDFMENEFKQSENKFVLNAFLKGRKNKEDVTNGMFRGIFKKVMKENEFTE